MKDHKIIGRALIWGGIMIVLILFLFLPNFAYLRSDLALMIQRRSFEKESVFHQNGLEFNIPTGDKEQKNGWCEKMKLYHPGHLFFSGDNKGQISILYNFGKFKKGRSTFYDAQSDYFNGHYGVYAIDLADKKFGWQDDGRIDTKAISDLVAYDHLDLVLDSLGCPPSKRFFESDIIAIKENQKFSGFSDWVEIDAVIETNAPLHQQKKYLLGYLQYGPPSPDYQGEDFPLVQMKGRLFMRYDETRDLTVIYFVMARGEKLIEETSEEYLKNIDCTN